MQAEDHDSLVPTVEPALEMESGESAQTGGKAAWLPVALFLLTGLTTLLAGAYQEGRDPFQRPADLIYGLPFSFTLMSILLCHEMGHYVASKRYGVQTTLPYFIPGPWPPFGLIGTFGAFIRIKSPILVKNALIDIGAAGPIAGFVVAVIAVGVGLQTSEIVPIKPGAFGLQLGDSLAFSLIARLLGKVPPEGYDIVLNPVAFAGWIGFFVTALNLLPIGQLDGGHVAYAMFGRRHRQISVAMVVALFVLGMVGWSGWYVWGALTAVLGIHHPPLVDEDIPFDRKHLLVGWGSVLLFVLTFTPVPFKVSP